MLVRIASSGMALLFIGSTALAQAGAPVLTVSTDGKPAISLDRAALDTMPQTETRAGAHDQPPSQWKGVALTEILSRAGAPSGHDLRGKALARYVRVSASDGYQVVFSLGELDPGTGHKEVLLADQQDNKPIGKEGPFRLIVPGDKRPARWIRNVVSIDIVDGAKP